MSELHDNAIANGYSVREERNGTFSVRCSSTGERLAGFSTRARAWDWAEDMAKESTALELVNKMGEGR